MEAIAALSGQERVDRYASRDKGRLSAPGSEAEPSPPEAQAAGVAGGGQRERRIECSVEVDGT